MADTTDTKPTSDAKSDWTVPAAGTEKVGRQKPAPLVPFDSSAPNGSKPKTRSERDKMPLSLDQLRKPTLERALIGLIVLALGFGGGWLGAAAHGDDGATNITEQRVKLEGQAAVISQIAQTVGQSVVSVDATQAAQPSDSQDQIDSLFGFGGGDSGDTSTADAGTGMILTSSGLIMTNRHVVPDGTTSVSVTLSNGTTYNNVKVVWRAPDSSSLDVAFLQIQNTNGQKLVPVSLGNSSSVNVGDPVVAIGNALGQYQNTVTSGIISGYGRSVQASSSDGSSTENLDDLLQTDAAINEGNSGGPLVNLNDQVIGMNTALASNSENIGFSIPINDIMGLIKQVENSGQVQLSYLGVMYVPITSDVVSEYNLSASQGAYIPTVSQNGGQPTVISGGPAANAGVQPGDIITAVNGTAINQTTSLISQLDQHQPGDNISLTINRGGKTMNINVTLGSYPSS